MKKILIEAALRAVLAGLDCAGAAIAVTWALCGGVNGAFVGGVTIVGALIAFVVWLIVGARERR